ncbi:FAD-dependent oxidoreductase [Pseudoduganella namucuonensis]|uniref:3-(3-hydroxy-phenyl)propionate hydroxylase n=1 Tax=Pseudoduganella namucuonensis TaxID=1035707 RepID=A0A1I7LE09_9BURK|nr:FAD-dependent oxidoreductase [Pseudoduganella namucuonensis]SFV07929.1 3-(3-hydroxy-phenyl)propionate hydroxylase [Pseudoduganella namucuonensis]
MPETSNSAAPAADSGGYTLPTYPYVTPPELSGGDRGVYPVVIVGAGLSGLTLACDLANRGIASVLLDEDDTIGVRGASSRGICYAQRSLEVFDRLGTYERMRAKGITWSTARVLSGDEALYSYDLSLASKSKQPPFINLQQFYVEWYLVDRIQALGSTDIRWRNRVLDASQEDGHEGSHVLLTVGTPDGEYQLRAQWVLDAAGVASVTRDKLGLDTHTHNGHDRWCITDVRFKKPLPVERWTWIEAPFNENRGVWQHLMADGVWRLDFQMEADADPAYVARPDVAHERVRAMLGPDVEFDIVWVGAYSYRRQLLDDYRDGRVFFLGDAAHVTNPFGARGGNTGIQDADNLGWKLALVLQGQAPEALLDSYNAERRYLQLHNTKVTDRSGRFMSPPTPGERHLRTAVLGLARSFPFARAILNPGRMSAPVDYVESPLNGGLGTAEGKAVPNLALGNGRWLADLVREGTAFVALAFERVPAGVVAAGLSTLGERYPLRVLTLDAGSDEVLAFMTEINAPVGSIALLRPDLHLATVLKQPSAALLERALRRALGHP